MQKVLPEYRPARPMRPAVTNGEERQEAASP